MAYTPSMKYGDNGLEEEERQRYRELLEELRTIIPGGQVLFAFLLTVPFATRFSEIDVIGKTIFAVSLMATAAATVLFLAPAAYHRLAGSHDRQGRLRSGVRNTLAGMVLLGLSVCCAVFVVVRFLFSSTPLGVVLATTVAVLTAAVWCVQPLRHRHRMRARLERT